MVGLLQPPSPLLRLHGGSLEFTHILEKPLTDAITSLPMLWSMVVWNDWVTGDFGRGEGVVWILSLVFGSRSESGRLLQYAELNVGTLRHPKLLLRLLRYPDSFWVSFLHSVLRRALKHIMYYLFDILLFYFPLFSHISKVPLFCFRFFPERYTKGSTDADVLSFHRVAADPYFPSWLFRHFC